MSGFPFDRPWLCCALWPCCALLCNSILALCYECKGKYGSNGALSQAKLRPSIAADPRACHPEGTRIAHIRVIASAGDAKHVPFAALSLLMPCLGLFLQAGCATRPSIASDLHWLQGYWEGEGPPGKISITITGSSLHFYARPDFWYERTFTLPAGADPKQLHATIKDSSSPTNGIGQVVFAIFKIEDGTLTLAVDDGSDEPPTTFSDALSRYHLKRAQPQEKNAKTSTLVVLPWHPDR